MIFNWTSIVRSWLVFRDVAVAQYKSQTLCHCKQTDVSTHLNANSLATTTGCFLYNRYYWIQNIMYKKKKIIKKNKNCLGGKRSLRPRRFPDTRRAMRWVNDPLVSLLSFGKLFVLGVAPPPFSSINIAISPTMQRGSKKSLCLVYQKSYSIHIGPERCFFNWK